jgi:hypothetical protein
MSQSRTRVACGITLALLSLTACVRELLPTSAAPEAATPHDAAISVPNVVPTPIIVPTPTPSPSVGPEAASCPTLLGIRVTVFAEQPWKNRVVLDATPLTDQCTGFPGRLVCPLGQAGTKRREECEVVRIGDLGPEWTIEPRGPATVDPLPGGGYLAEVVGKGLVTACSRIQPDVCANIDIR